MENALGIRREKVRVPKSPPALKKDRSNTQDQSSDPVAVARANPNRPSKIAVILWRLIGRPLKPYNGNRLNLSVESRLNKTIRPEILDTKNRLCLRLCRFLHIMLAAVALIRCMSRSHPLMMSQTFVMNLGVAWLVDRARLRAEEKRSLSMFWESL